MEDIILSPSQQAVVDEFPGFLLSKDREMTIAGAAGTGKTFLVQYLTKMASAMEKMCRLLDPSIPRREFLYTATTNKAAEVLRSTVEQDTMTIHSCLGLRVQNDYKSGKQVLVPTSHRQSLKNMVVFVDEASMINDELAACIREAITEYPGCKLVFIGDKYQLPPVREDICSVFRPGAPNVHELTDIQRQAQDSPIITLATAYRSLLDNLSETWPEIPHDGENIIHYQSGAEYKEAMRERFSAPHDPDDYKVVAWSNKRVRQYNHWIRTEVLGQSLPFNFGDRVTTTKPLIMEGSMVATTDRRLTVDFAERGTATVGDHTVDGWYISLRGKPGQVFQPLDWNDVRPISKAFAEAKEWAQYFSIKENWADLRPIHASTVHKSQGSTYREVFVDLADIGRNTRWRDLVRLIYVALTRASEKVHIYGSITTKHQVRPAEDTLEAFTNVHGLLQR